MSLTVTRSAAGFALLAALAAGCGTAGPVLSSGTQPIPVPSSASVTAPAAALSACSLLKPADVLAVAATFPHVTITIDGHQKDSTPPTNECGYNQKGVYTGADSGMTINGDQWAQLTVVTGGSAYEFDPPGNGLIKGLGNGAYWEAGSNTVVVLVGQNVLQVVDNVPANVNSTGAVGAAYRQAAQALAAKILSHI
jgi:hypothetical protein